MKLRQLYIGAFLCLSFSMVGSAGVNDSAPYRFQDINKMSEADYMVTFTPLLNDEQWVVKESSQKRPFTGFVDMFTTIVNIIDKSDYKTKLALIEGHPDLECPALRKVGIAEASQEEQKSSGLNSCTDEEAKKLLELNKQYDKKFGFPFLLAVKGYDKSAIFKEIEERLNNDPKTEFNIAMQQYYKVILERMLTVVK